MSQYDNCININISNAAFDRLESLIEILLNSGDLNRSDMTDREAMIIRLRAEAKLANNEWYERGKSKGLELAPKLSFDRFQQVLLWYETKGYEHDEETSMMDLIPSHAFLLAAIDIDNCPPYLRDAYLSGAIIGIAQFWESIEDEVLD